MGNKPIFAPKQRVISQDGAPASEDSCNSRLMSRDGYCQLKGVAPYNRCSIHGGNISKAADLFKKSVSIETAEKLQVLMEDTLNMDNELATGKTLLLTLLEQFDRSAHVIKEYQDMMPKRPTPYDTDMERATYSDAVNLHIEMIKMATELRDRTFKQSQLLIKTLSEGVKKNSQMKEGSKFTLDAKQISSILRLQLTVMKDNCAGCPKLKSVLKGIQEGVKDIPIDPTISKQNKDILGQRQYRDMVNKVEKVGEAISGKVEDADFDLEE